MNLAELRQEVLDRGFDYVKTSRIEEFLQRAHREICSRRNWPFLETSEEGEAPLEFTDLGRILTVQRVDNGALIPGSTRRWLLSRYADLTTSGVPAFWYLEDKTLRLYPAAPETVLVHYLKRPAKLAANDEPLVPDEWQYLMVDRAVVECLKDDDEYEQAAALYRDVRDGIAEMASELLHRNRQDNRSIIRTGGPWDYAS